MKTILIIDDTFQYNFLTIRDLKSKYKLILIDNVEAAISFCESNFNNSSIDLIILDIMMKPGPYYVNSRGQDTGYLFYKDKLVDSSIPIIVWTRYHDIVDKPWGANVKYFVNKSSSSSDILEKIDDILNTNQ